MKNLNLKVRTIDVNIRQGEANLGDGESSIMINSGCAERGGLVASLKRVKDQDWEDSEMKSAHKRATSGITTNEFTLNNQLTI